MGIGKPEERRFSDTSRSGLNRRTVSGIQSSGVKTELARSREVHQGVRGWMEPDSFSWEPRCCEKCWWIAQKKRKTPVRERTADTQEYESCS